jgi:hypothetical protein
VKKAKSNDRISEKASQVEDDRPKDSTAHSYTIKTSVAESIKSNDVSSSLELYEGTRQEQKPNKVTRLSEIGRLDELEDRDSLIVEVVESMNGKKNDIGKRTDGLDTP